MARAYNVIDADGHVLEPVDIWDKYIDPAYRERAPRIIVDTDGKERLQVGEQVLGSQKGFGVIGAIGSRDHEVPEETMKYIDGRKGGFDPHARIPDMDLDGIDAAFLYPSVGLFSGAIKEPKLAAAVCRAYNRWLAEYCQPYPDRLFGVAMLPMQSIELAIEEMRYARKELGMRAGFLRPNPYNGRMLHHPDYEVFWSAVEDLDMAIGLHEGASGGMPQVGVDRFESRSARHIISHTMEMMLAAMSVIWEGVCDRHPKVRIGFMESGGGLDRPLARPHGSPLRRQGLQRHGSLHAPHRALPPQLLDLLRAGGGQPLRARGLHRRPQDPVGDRLPASRRLLPRRTQDDRRPSRAVRGDEASDPRRRSQGLLQAQLSALPSPPPGERAG